MIFSQYSYGMDIAKKHATLTEHNAALRGKALQKRLKSAGKSIKSLKEKYKNFPGAVDRELLDLFLSIELDEADYVKRELQKLQSSPSTHSSEKKSYNAPVLNQSRNFTIVGGLLLKSSRDPDICTLIEAYNLCDALIEKLRYKSRELEQKEYTLEERHAYQMYYAYGIEHYELQKDNILSELGNNPQLAIL